MKILVWAFRILLFALFFGFALLNTERAHLDFLFGVWSAPMALIALLFFAAGTLFGVLVVVPTVLRDKRELRRARNLRVPSVTPASAEPPRLG
jgi:lipopolysaccharide assembly protein A